MHRLLILALLLLPMASSAQISGDKLPPVVPTLQGAAPVLTANDIGRGTVALDGPWQFHLGDDPAFAQPGIDDATGHGGWEQITTNRPWGAQSHRSYTGYAWYRRHLDLSPAPGSAPDLSLLIEHIDDVYEIYWNGVLVGHNGEMPPHPYYPFSQASQLFRLGPLRDGVLAIRVWKEMSGSTDNGLIGGPTAPPVIGSATAIADRAAALNYEWLKSNQYEFALSTLQALVMVLALLAWLRDRSQRLPLWVAIYYFCYLLRIFLLYLQLPFSFNIAYGIWQPFYSLRDVALWFLLLWLLNLMDNRRLVKLTIVCAAVSLCFGILDGLNLMFAWDNPLTRPWAQLVDGIVVVPDFAFTLLTLVIVAFSLRRRLDWPRRFVAVFAFSHTLLYDVVADLEQGSRYTGLTLGEDIRKPLFHLFGTDFNAERIALTGLLLSIVYAAYVYSREASERQATAQQELHNARAIQQVLVPEKLPITPGFEIASIYLPFGEVGGDFFQIIPLADHSVLIAIGDVSGKGLPAAMIVSLLVGALRMAAETTSSPAAILKALSRQVLGRSSGGFTTCLILRVDTLPGDAGKVTIANAGHVAPYLDGKEVQLENGLPLGLVEDAVYTESSFTLPPSARLTLVTDGVVEARNPTTGELFGFDRTAAISTQSAEAIATAAQAFGQDDDITVLTLAPQLNLDASLAEMPDA